MRLAFRDKNITGSGGQIIQVDVLSEAVQSDVGKIYQYIGETTDEFTNGYFYKCIANDDGTYSWSNIPVQEGNGNTSLSFWQPNTTYKVNDLCLYKETNYYSVYICTADHTSADTFVSAYWETIDGTEFEGYTEDEILAMLNLSQDELITLQSLINDTEITTLKTWSSSNTYTYIQDAIKTTKEYTEKMLNRYNKVSFLIVTSLNDMTETGYIYLMDNGSGTFDMYIVQDDATIKPIGNMSVDLTEYTKTEELERDYLKIADAEGTYAKITTVDDLAQEVDDLGLMKPVNENWIINGDFKVWSNGENFTTSTECIYTADRWKTHGFAFIDISKTDNATPIT